MIVHKLLLTFSTLIWWCVLYIYLLQLHVKENKNFFQKGFYSKTYSGAQKSESTQLPFFIFDISLLIIHKFMFLS